MKITPEDMNVVREVLRTHFPEYGPRGTDDQLDLSLASILVQMYDRGYDQAVADSVQSPGQCPYTFSHTRHWCGYPDCRDS